MLPTQKDLQLSFDFNDNSTKQNTKSQVKVVNFSCNDDLRRQSITKSIVLNTKSF